MLDIWVWLSVHTGPIVVLISTHLLHVLYLFYFFQGEWGESGASGAKGENVEMTFQQ